MRLSFWFFPQKSKRVTQQEMFEISKDIGPNSDSLAALLGKLDKLKEFRQDLAKSNNAILHLLFEWDKGGGERQTLVEALKKIDLHLAQKYDL